MRISAELFADKGFRGTTTRAIAGACGVSEATIFKHFETKDELYDAIILDHLEAQGELGLTDELRESGDDRAFFQTFAANFLQFAVTNQVFWRLLLRSALEDHELATRFFENHLEERIERLANHIRTRQEDGAFRDLDPSLTANMFIGMLAHYINHTQIFKRPKFAQTPLDDMAAFITDLFLKGVQQS